MYRLIPDCQGSQDRADIDLVAPLASKATATHTTEIAGNLPGRSGAVSPVSNRGSDVDSANNRSMPATATMPGRRTSTTATRTTNTRTTSWACARSADQTTIHADFSFLELVRAYYNCRQGKRNKYSALDFELNLERNLEQLYDELQDGSYRPGPSICFVITRPKPREVWAAAFRDRVVHHLLYAKIAPRFHASFIADSCACIPGRGTLYGAERLEAKIRSITQNWKKPAHYLKCDIANFFVSIDKHILFKLIAAKVPEPWWLRLAELILFNDPREGAEIQSRPEKMKLVPEHKSLFNQPSNIGLPIGNLPSQLGANIYMNELDQFAKHIIRARYYTRYVDDFILLHQSPEWLNDAQDRIEVFLRENLSLQLNSEKTITQPIDRGVDYVGQVIEPHRRTTRRRTFNDAIHRIEHMPDADLFESANSYFGLLRQASHSKFDRARLGRALLKRGCSINKSLTKTYRKEQQ